MRHFRAPCLALVAVCAMGAVMSSAAQAATPTRLTAKEGATSLTSAILTAEAAGTQTFTTNTGKISCPAVSIGEATVKTPATTFEVHPEFKGTESVKCKAFGLNATVTSTGCNFKYTITETKVAGEAIMARVQVICSGTNKITIKATGTNCVVTVGSQTLAEEVTFNNNGAGFFETIANLFGIDYTETGTNCVKNGAESSNGTYTGTVKLRGYKDVEGKEGTEIQLLVD